MRTDGENHVVDLMKWRDDADRCLKMRYLAQQRAEEFQSKFAKDPLEVLICCLDAQGEKRLGSFDAVEQIFNERLKREIHIRQEVLKVAKETHLNGAVVYGIFITELDLS